MRTLFLAIAVLLPVFSAAQEARPVSCRFLSFEGSGGLQTVLTRTTGGNEVTCPLHTSSPSPPIECLATANRITFLSPDDRQPLGVATIPSGAKSVILLFIQIAKNPAAADEKTWQIIAIEDTPDKFPNGGAYIGNFYNRDIRFIVGEHKGMLRPATFHGYERPGQRDDFNMAPVVFEFLQGETWRTASESMLRFTPGMRYLIFAYVDPVSNRPRIKTFQDTAPSIPAEP